MASARGTACADAGVPTRLEACVAALVIAAAHGGEREAELHLHVVEPQLGEPWRVALGKAARKLGGLAKQLAPAKGA